MLRENGLTTLVDLVGKAGLADALSGPGNISSLLLNLKLLLQNFWLYLSTVAITNVNFSTGPFTVFAPTNDAFGAVDPSTFTALLKDANLLKRVLTYHVVASALLPSSIKNELVTRSLAGESLRVNVYGSGANAVLYIISLF